MSALRPDAVILVHGTYAGHVDDDGPGWWQKGHRNFSGWLEAQLSGVAACDRVFHWSGENKERARREAGKLLLARLREREAKGQPYHLVGHSHGGSVIWAALRAAAAGTSSGSVPLPMLRSWTTVGTPFLTYRTRWTKLLYLLPLLATIPLLASILGQAGVVAEHFGSIWSDPSLSPTTHWANRRSLVGLVGIWAAVLSISVLALHRLGVLACGVIMTAKDATLDRRAAEAFRGRGRFLWSREDEAINGLRTSLVLHDLRRRRHEPPLAARPEDAAPSARDRDSSAGEEPVKILPRKGLASWVYGPVADQFFFEILKQFLQGNDLVGRRLAAVTPEPPGFTSEPALPDDLQIRLEDHVTRGIVQFPETLHRLRRVLGEVAFGGQLQSPFETEPGRAAPVHAALMIHTLYFDSPNTESNGANGRDAIGSPIPSLITELIRASAVAPGGALPAGTVAIWSMPASPELTGDAIAARLAFEGIVATPRARFKEATVPMTVCGALLVFLCLPAVIGPRLFDRVLPYTIEGRMRGLVSDAGPVVRDAASDNETLGAVADYAQALADAHARGPLRRLVPGPLEARVVPALVMPAGDVEETIGKVDEARLRADLMARAAMALATANPPRQDLARRYADRAVAEAKVSQKSDPGTAVEVLVKAARVRYLIGDRNAAIRLVNGAAELMSSEIAGRFLQIQQLDAAIQENQPPALLPPPPPTAPGEAAGPQGGRGAPPGPGKRSAEVPPDARPAPAPLDPEATGPVQEQQANLPGYNPPPQAVSRLEQDLANRMAMQVLDAAELGLEMGDRALAVRLLERLIADYERVETMGSRKGFPSHYWSFGFHEELRLAELLRSLKLEETHPQYRSHLANLLPGLREMYPSEPAWLAIAEEAGPLGRLGLVEVVTTAAREALVPGPYMPDCEGIAGIAATMASLKQEDPARKAAAEVLRRLSVFRPTDSEVKQARFPNTFYRNYSNRIVDRYPLYRISLRMKIARLGLAGGGIPGAADLIDASWKDALSMESRAAEVVPSRGLLLVAPSMSVPIFGPDPTQEKGLELTPTAPTDLLVLSPAAGGLEPVNRAAALAEIVATAAHLDGPEAAAVREGVLDLYFKLAADPKAGLAEEAAHSFPLGIAVRHLVATLAGRGELDRARALADAIPLASQRIASQLIVAEHLARGDARGRVEAGRLTAQIEQQIAADLPRRLDRSPRLAECAAVWAMLGETARGLAARQDCRLFDRLQADTVLLAWFAIPSGGRPAIRTPDMFALPPVFDNPGTRNDFPIVLRRRLGPPGIPAPPAPDATPTSVPPLPSLRVPDAPRVPEPPADAPNAAPPKARS